MKNSPATLSFPVPVSLSPTGLFVVMDASALVSITSTFISTGSSLFGARDGAILSTDDSSVTRSSVASQARGFSPEAWSGVASASKDRGPFATISTFASASGVEAVLSLAEASSLRRCRRRRRLSLLDDASDVSDVGEGKLLGAASLPSVLSLRSSDLCRSRLRQSETTFSLLSLLSVGDATSFAFSSHSSATRTQREMINAQLHWDKKRSQRWELQVCDATIAC